jgi:aminoglycoside phosphotransferase (APT) family kinase protein
MSDQIPLAADPRLDALVAWSASLVGPCQVASGDPRFHGRSTVLQLESEAGRCYLKWHREADSWGTEVHGYERWAPCFGGRAPRLLGVHDAEPLALLIGAVPGTRLEDTPLPEAQQRAAWRAAGEALAGLHAQPAGDHFGPCRRDGSPLGAPESDAVTHVRADLARWAEPGARAGWLTPDELRLVDAARERASVFGGERPVACHRDYNPYNWMVADDGRWSGVIDFEFAYPDVRVAEFSRYPDWEYLHRPDLVAALLAGYGRALTPIEEQQLLVAHVQYAVAAVVWGQQHDFFGFRDEGHAALAQLAQRWR